MTPPIPNLPVFTHVTNGKPRQNRDSALTETHALPGASIERKLQDYFDRGVERIVAQASRRSTSVRLNATANQMISGTR